MDAGTGIYYAKAAALFGAALAMGIGSIGPAIGQGMIGMKACENIGKYAENANKIRNTMVLAMSIVEAAAVYCLVIALFLIFVKID